MFDDSKDTFFLEKTYTILFIEGRSNGGNPKIRNRDNGSVLGVHDRGGREATQQVAQSRPQVC